MEDLVEKIKEWVTQDLINWIFEDLKNYRDDGYKPGTPVKIGILGKSGSGKSSFINTVAHLTKENALKVERGA